MSEFTPTQLEKLRRFEAAPTLPEAFDATAAVRRVLALACDLETGWTSIASPTSRGIRLQYAHGRAVADRIRNAVNGPAS